MRAGVIKFLTGQDPPPTLKRDSHRYLTPEDDETPPTSGQSEQLPKVKSKPNEKDMLKVVAWEPCNGPKGGFNRREVKRRRYQTEEGAKVARNRGNACERHRRQKLKVSAHSTLISYSTLTLQSATQIHVRITGNGSRSLVLI